MNVALKRLAIKAARDVQKHAAFRGMLWFTLERRINRLKDELRALLP